jgi:hypothetical protein
MRRYGGFYASNIQRRIKRKEVTINKEKTPNKTWAKLIAKISGELPTLCPFCKEEMKLVRFICEKRIIIKELPWVSGAPPPVQYEGQERFKGSLFYDEDVPAQEYEIVDQTPPEYFDQGPVDEKYFNQETPWD